MLTPDMCLQRSLFPERLTTWRIAAAVKFRFVNVLMSLKSAVRSEALPAAFPVAHKGSLFVRGTVGISKVSLEVVFPGKRLVAAYLWAGERSFLVVATHVGFETAWAVESLATPIDLADEVPLPAGFAVCSTVAVVGEVYYLVHRIV